MEKKLPPKQKSMVVRMPDELYQQLKMLIRSQQDRHGLDRYQVLRRLIEDVIRANPDYQVPPQVRPRLETIARLRQEAAQAKPREKAKLTRRLEQAERWRAQNEAKQSCP